MTERMSAATDGSAQPNPGPTAWAWVLADEHGRPGQGASGFLGHATNNVGELTAVAELLRATDPALPLEIRIDSKYAMNVLTGRYAASQNRELIAGIQELLSDRDITFTWVRAHQANGDAFNAIADRTANEAVRRQTGHTWTSPDQLPGHEPLPPTPPRPKKTRSPTTDAPAKMGAAERSCARTTKAGEPCRIEPRASGLCHVHDPSVQCQAITAKGQPCTVATGGGRCVRHHDQIL